MVKRCCGRAQQRKGEFMIRITQLKLPVEHTPEQLKKKIAKTLKCAEDTFSYEIVRQSLDARHKDDKKFVYTVDVKTAAEQKILRRVHNNNIMSIKKKDYQFPLPGTEKLEHVPVIVGSGPAGLSAAIYAQRAMLDQIVIEKEMFSGGQIINTDRIDNYLGLYGENGYDLAVKFREHADALEVPFVEGKVESIEDKGEYKEIHLEDGATVDAKAVIIATGAKHRLLNVKGEKEFTGAGVSYCATCDGAFFKNKTVAVVGGGDVALEDALYLSHICEKVYLVHRRDELRGAKILQSRIFETKNIEFKPSYEVSEIYGEDIVTGAKLLNKKTGEEEELSLSAVFIAVGMEPQSEFIKGLVDTDKTGYIIATEDCRTSMDKVYAVGDIRTKSLRQVVTAVADGAVAITSIEQDTK